MNALREGSSPLAQSCLRLALGIGWGTIVVILLGRSAVGAIERTPGPITIAVLAAAGFALALTVWRLDDAARPSDDWSHRTARAAAAILSGLLCGLLVARTSLPGLISVVTMALACSVGAVLWILNINAADSASAASATTQGNTNPTFGIEAEVQPPAVDDPSLQMQLRRYRDADAERIELQARLEFVAGAREAVLHVPFWPALVAVPDVECEPLEGDDIELRVTSAEPYGVRIEGRLPTAALTSRMVLVGVEVRALLTGGQQSAAA